MLLLLLLQGGLTLGFCEISVSDSAAVLLLLGGLGRKEGKRIICIHLGGGVCVCLCCGLGDD